MGIYDDVTHLSLDVDHDFRTLDPDGEVQAMFFGSAPTARSGQQGLGEDHRREHRPLGQGYFVYDSKKSGR